MYTSTLDSYDHEATIKARPQGPHSPGSCAHLLSFLSDDIDEVLVDEEDELQTRDLHNRVIVQFMFVPVQDRFAIDIDGSLALVGDVKVSVAPQFDDALSP